MLDSAALVAEPWPCWTFEQALGEKRLGEVRAAITDALDWVRHDSFYQCHMAQLTEQLSPAFLAALRERVAEISGWPLAEQVNVTAQRMGRGDHAKPHTDRPLLGFETVRLVVQLTEDWSPSRGGWFCAHPDVAGEALAWRRGAHADGAVLFAADPAAHHSVTPVVDSRLTAVFNFWHLGNTEHTEAWVAGLFAQADLGALPPELDALVVHSEATLPFELTTRAALAAWACSRWTDDVAVVRAAYLATLKDGPPDVATPTAALLASWAALLFDEGFPVRAWAPLAERVWAEQLEGAAAEARAVLFPWPPTR